MVGVIAQFGGQTPIKLAKFLNDNRLPILGTQYTSIDLAEDRNRFRNLLNKLKLNKQKVELLKHLNKLFKLQKKLNTFNG